MDVCVEYEYIGKSSFSLRCRVCTLLSKNQNSWSSAIMKTINGNWPITGLDFWLRYNNGDYWWRGEQADQRNRLFRSRLFSNKQWYICQELMNGQLSGDESSWNFQCRKWTFSIIFSSFFWFELYEKCYVYKHIITIM